MGWELKKYPMYCAGVRETNMSKSVVVGNIIFLSGMDGVSLETGKVPSNKIEDQMVACLDNIRNALEEAGSSLDNLVKNIIFVKKIEDCPIMWKTMLEYFQKHAPSLVEEPPVVIVSQIGPMVRPECFIEIDSMAVVSIKNPDCDVRKYPMYYGGKKQIYPNVQPGKPFFSAAVAVGNLLFLSGMAGENPDTGKIETDDFGKQMKLSWDKVKKVMGEAGSSLNNVIRTFHFQTRVEDFLVQGKERGAAYGVSADRLWHHELWYYEHNCPWILDDFPAHMPTSTFMKMKSLEDPEARFSVDITGVVSRFDRPGWEVKHYPSYMARRGFPRGIADVVKYYSNTIVVGNLIWISGQPGWDLTTGRIESENFEDQMIVALDNLKYAMEQSGSSLEYLVKTNMLLVNAKDYPKMREMELEYYKKYAPRLVDEPPASSCIQLYNLYSPMCIVELDAVGYLPDP